MVNGCDFQNKNFAFLLFSLENNTILKLPSNAVFFQKCTFSALSISGRKGALSSKITALLYGIVCIEML